MTPKRREKRRSDARAHTLDCVTKADAGLGSVDHVRNPRTIRTNMRHTVLEIPDGGGKVRHVHGPAPVGAAICWRGRSLLGASAGEIASGEVVWSGSYAEVEGGAVFDEDPRTWGAKGWDALRTRVESGERGVVIRPHARHVVSDVPGCRRLLETSWATERGVRLCYDPASMLVPGMMGRIEDHLLRMYEAIELFPVERLAMVVVAGVGDDGEGAKLAARLAAAWVPASVPIAILDGSSGELAGWLSDAGA